MDSETNKEQKENQQTEPRDYALTADGRLVRCDEPSYSETLTKSWEGRPILRERWLLGRYRHRMDGPALTEMDIETGTITRELWCREDAVHRDEDLPAEIDHDPTTCKIIYEGWWHENRPHRIAAPSALTYDPETGAIIHESWGINGILHREDGPAVTTRSQKTGVIVYELWCLNGEQHREGGPAEIRRDSETGAITYAQYWIHNVSPNGPLVKRHRTREELSTLLANSLSLSALKL